MKRPRMDVNLEELDQIIDRGTHAPLSESEGEKLKRVLHAPAGMLLAPTDAAVADARHARLRSQARLDHRAQIKEAGSGAAQRKQRSTLLASARRREIDVVLVWRLDRWGRSVADLVSTLQELQHLAVGFVSLTEALDLTTPAGRAMAGLLAVFARFEREILRERVRAGLDHARQQGKRLGRPPSVVHQAVKARKLHRQGISKSEIARRLQISRSSVRRLLAPKKS